MDAHTAQSEVDPLTPESIEMLAGAAGTPCVSLHLPTHRSGPETLQDPIRLRNLIDRAAASGAPERALAPMRALLDDTSFWQHQADGLALFATEDLFCRFRLPVPVDEQVVVADTFRVRPLVPLISDHDDFRILALSKNAVRLFDADRYRITEVDLDGVPTSLAEALKWEDPERQLQNRSAGGDGVMFHGHGGGEEDDKGELERFFRAVDHGLRERHGVTGTPLVLASVGYYQPIFASVTTAHTVVLDEVAEGNPERRSPAELHAEAWAIVQRTRAAAGGHPAWQRFGDASGTGMTAEDLSSVVLAAAHGRVDTLFVAPGPPVAGAVDLDDATVRVAEGGQPGGEYPTDLVDRAVLDTMRHRGEVAAVEPGQLPDGVHAAALLRY